MASAAWYAFAAPCKLRSLVNASPTQLRILAAVVRGWREHAQNLVWAVLTLQQIRQRVSEVIDRTIHLDGFAQHPLGLGDDARVGQDATEPGVIVCVCNAAGKSARA